MSRRQIPIHTNFDLMMMMVSDEWLICTDAVYLDIHKIQLTGSSKYLPFWDAYFLAILNKSMGVPGWIAGRWGTYMTLDLQVGIPKCEGDLPYKLDWPDVYGVSSAKHLSSVVFLWFDQIRCCLSLNFRSFNLPCTTRSSQDQSIALFEHNMNILE